MDTKLFLDRTKRLFWYIYALSVRYFIPVKRNRIIFGSYSFTKYACNPRYLTEYLLDNHSDEFELVWIFNKNIPVDDIDPRVKVVRKYSFSYIHALYSSRFFIYNKRNNRYETMYVKKHNQKYIMAWHASLGLKKIEFDAIDQLGKCYISHAEDDSKMCDLMLSNSTYYSKQIPNTFRYRGEILEHCIPRNDIFYNKAYIQKCRDEIRDQYSMSSKDILVIYAPTFRYDSNVNIYKLDWERICLNIKLKHKCDVKVLVKLHPNIAHIKEIEEIIDYNNVYNVSKVNEIAPLLFASDIVITDYSSIMFDCAILNKQCLLYTPDHKTYDRGFCWTLESLPFPIAYSEDELIINIRDFSKEIYDKNIKEFKNTIWGLEEDGKACERLYNWIKKNR